jgi:site-specific DNA-methyltransferase (adenine-specific)/adenine-specific DNA-methyltransferase
MDEIFGEHNFLNDISWCYKEREISRTNWNEKHDHILYYKAGRQPVFNWNEITLPYSEGTIRKYTLTDKDGRKFQIRGKGGPYLGKQQLSIKIEKEHPKWVYRDYLDEKPGILPRDWWDDIPFVNRAAAERTNFPTQKPEKLLERVIKASSNRGDIVFDAFAGSGTTLAIAEKLGRRWIGIDCSKLAIYTIQKRMINLKKEIGNKGSKLKPKPFNLYNAGLYDFSKLKELPWDSWRFFALQLFQCREDLHTIGGISLDGYLKGASVLVFNHMQEPGVRIDEETIVSLHEALGSRVGNKLFIIAPALTFDFQQDYIDLDGVRYYALRIPYSIIHELHRREFTALKQPSDEMAVNDSVEAVGFDFIRTPELKYKAGLERKKDEQFEHGFIKITTFKSEAVVREPYKKKKNLETLSMVMLDYDYDEQSQVFGLDNIFYADAIEKDGWKVRFPIENLGKKIMAVFIDIYGNEARVLMDVGEFRKSSSRRAVTKKSKKNIVKRK